MVNPNTHAQGTTAGFTIETSTTINYQFGTQNINETQDFYFPVVNEILSFSLSANQSSVDVINQQQNALLTYQLINNGNGSEDFVLDIQSSGDFSSNYQVYFEDYDAVNGNQLSIITGGNDETLYAPGQVINMQADQHIVIYLLTNIPNALSNSSTSIFEVTALSQSSNVSSAALGQVLIGAGQNISNSNSPLDGTASDLIVLTEFGQSKASAQFFVNQTGVSVDKSIESSSLTVAGQQITGRFVQGAIVTYLVTVVVNSGTANNLLIQDPIDVSMSYIAESIEYQDNTSPYLSIPDNGSYFPNENKIKFSLGNKTDGTYRLKYQAIIN